MFMLHADKSSLSVLKKGIITSGAVNVIDVQFQFSPEWNGMDRVAVFKVGTQKTSVVLDENNSCKLPWECVRENDIGKTVNVGVCGMIGANVVLPTVWVGIGTIKEGTQLGNTALPHTPSVSQQILGQVMAARDEAEEAAHRAEVAAGIAEDNTSDIPEDPDHGENENPDDPGPGDNTGDENVSDDNIATDEEVNDALDDIFGA